MARKNLKGLDIGDNRKSEIYLILLLGKCIRKSQAVYISDQLERHKT